mmetsp:Transcript_32447/g.53664  ORF Transcript_32447/g.53664 Transcript_32447/m.53664 type:complete len:230 (+) Transcript_32447:239-928(+)|eukprot:CAMPEP_0119004072 /NCGR_PEP_ID=MMETSP1176-20130426/938_1 /TAXON_ID=265551 /ORGANISM="Synedropsis recta cf, Strain CCMP1620" /LENGTH=229 /DNA_ID=CAMNT_0006955741 /DNA_START=227 /DNA_END=916 /DNA_ORIENTATION=-
MAIVTSTPTSVLVVGATGGTGSELMKQLYVHHAHPRVHAFCRDPNKLNNTVKNCHSVVKGNARNSNDLKRAIEETKADVVIISVGNGESTAKTNIRTANARAMAHVLIQPQFRNVRAVVVSSQGAGNSEIKVGLGIGAIVSFHLRHVLADHTGQEQVLTADGLKSRTLIVRATALTDDQPAAKVVEFGDKVKSPSIKTDRSDLARYVVDKIFGPYEYGGQIVNITGMKQ